LDDVDVFLDQGKEPGEEIVRSRREKDFWAPCYSEIYENSHITFHLHLGVHLALKRFIWIGPNLIGSVPRFVIGVRSYRFALDLGYSKQKPVTHPFASPDLLQDQRALLDYREFLFYILRCTTLTCWARQRPRG
jgi:hypothetical protein